MLSLEDDETLSVPLPDAKVSEDEVLEAEILEADLIDDVEISLEDEAEKVPLPAATSTSTPLPTSYRHLTPDAHGDGASPASHRRHADVGLAWRWRMVLREQPT